LHNTVFVLFYVFLALSVLTALAGGGSPERLGASIIVVIAVVEWLARPLVPIELHTVDPLAVSIDAFGTISFGALALHARRAWPIWATALQILSMTSHFAQGVDPAAHRGIYVVMKSGPTFLVLFVLLVGTISHRLRLRRHGSDPAWMGW
jgi:hypothetical protein